MERNMEQPVASQRRLRGPWRATGNWEKEIARLPIFLPIGKMRMKTLSKIKYCFLA